MIREILLSDLAREAELTRETLERVQEGRDDFRPHPKSMPMGYLATLLAIMPSWVPLIINTEEFDIAPVGGPKYSQPELKTQSELQGALTENVEQARAALEGTTDENLSKRWILKLGGRIIRDQPRHEAIRDSVLSHLAHHRGQLTVYLRLNDASVPALYGSSADEQA